MGDSNVCVVLELVDDASGGVDEIGNVGLTRFRGAREMRRVSTFFLGSLIVLDKKKAARAIVLEFLVFQLVFFWPPRFYFRGCTAHAWRLELDSRSLA